MRKSTGTVPAFFEDIGGVFGGFKGFFDASPATARRLIELGRKDAHLKLAAV